MLTNFNVYQPQPIASIKQKNSFTRNKAEPQQGVYRHVIKLTISEDAQQRYASYKRQLPNNVEEANKDISTDNHGRKLQHFIAVNVEKSNKNVERAIKTLSALSYPKKVNVNKNQQSNDVNLVNVNSDYKSQNKKLKKFDIVKFDLKITNEKAMNRVFDSYKLHAQKVYA